MKQFTLNRYCYSAKMGTFGLFSNGGGGFNCFSVEQPWNNNLHDQSCIPEGMYLAKLLDHPIHGMTYELQDVPGRSAILIHAGNTAGDVRGCIALGNREGSLDGGIWAVMESAYQDGAYTRFMRYMEGAPELQITIQQYRPFQGGTNGTHG